MTHAGTPPLCRLQVYVRLRPVLDEAAGVPCLAGDPEEPTVLVSRVRWHRQALRSSGRRTLDALPQSPKADSPKQEHTYDRVFRQGAGQVEVFNEVRLQARCGGASASAAPATALNPTPSPCTGHAADD